MTSGLFLNLDAGAVLVTALPKQAEQFRLSYAHWKREQGLQAWSSPEILSWSEWLKRMGEDLLWSGYSGSQGVRSLLTPLQEQTVWEQVIRADLDQPLLHLPSTAALARQAWGLMQGWRMPDPSAAQFPSGDVKAFTKWVSSYYKRCKTAAWLDQARLPDTLKRAIKLDKVDLPERLILAGFVQLTPQQLELITAIKQKQVQVSLYKANTSHNKNIGRRYVSTSDEFYAISDWARKILEQNPHSRIGIAVPNLKQNRPELDYQLRKVLYPNSLSSDEEFLNAAYQFSSGEALSDSAVAQMAMALLELINGHFDLDHISKILRNPYCYGGRAEYLERIKIDAWLRTQGLLEFDLNTLLNLFKSYHRSAGHDGETTLFEVSLMTLRTTSGLAKNFYSPSIWAKHFLSYLEKFGWPDIKLNSVEQRHAHAMRSCLTEFASIDFVQNEMDLNNALSSLRRLYLSKRLNTTQVFAPIQILDLKEIYGLNFEYLWVAQLNDKALPESSVANPMLPYVWQRKRKIAGASPETRMQEAVQRITHLKQASEQTIFSYSVDGNADQEHDPAMLRDIDFLEVQTAIELPQEALLVEWISETHAPVYQGDKEVSSSIFKYQAECPFKAFAKTRLKTSTLETATHGLTALERGKLLHSALEFVWLRIGASDTLSVAMQSEHLEMQIWEIVDKVLSIYEKRLNYKLSKPLKAIEQNRLVRLTMAWLAVESERAPFELHRSEYESEVEINGLQVKCRIDRIDEVNDIGFVIIDYKSGVKTSGSWFGDRPDEPQMPIYALAEQNRLVALAFATLKPGAYGFNGISHSDNILPGIKAYDDLSDYARQGRTWAELIPYWRDTLGKLSDSYQTGLAIPDPKKGDQTCRYCELESLCRVNSNKDYAQARIEGEHV